jgi:type VI secretion system secreted protein Hcp
VYEFYVTIVGAKQGAFHGETDDERHRGKLVGLAYDLPVSAQGSGSGKTGMSGFGPVRFTRRWGPASPQFLTALATNEALSTAIFEFERATDEGERQVFQRVTLFGARVTEVRAFLDLEAEPSALMSLPPLEEVALSCRGILVENVIAGTSGRIGTVPAQPKPSPTTARRTPARSVPQTPKPTRTRR